MHCLQLANKYFEAWNNHDAHAIVKCFADSGTYSDPNSGVISGNAIGKYAKSLWEMFPDLSFEIISKATTGSNSVVGEWLMKGTNTGPFKGLSPTGKTISLSGIDVIKMLDGQISSLTGYFDSAVIPAQLGLQITIQPFTAGPFSFGRSTHVQSGNKSKPGAFAITAIHSPLEHEDEIVTLSRDTAIDMLSMDGFIGLNLIRIGTEGYTISAWEKPEQTKQIMSNETHKKAVVRFYEEIVSSGYTSVWAPFYYNDYKVRCNACKKMVQYEKNAGVCNCGQNLPEPPPYF